MELTKEDKEIIVNLLMQISLPVVDAEKVLKIVEKLKK